MAVELKNFTGQAGKQAMVSSSAVSPKGRRSFDLTGKKSRLEATRTVGYFSTTTICVPPFPGSKDPYGFVKVRR